MPVPAYGHAEFVIQTQTGSDRPQIFIPTLASLGTPLTNHDRIIRFRVKEITSTAPAFPVKLYGIVNSANTGITFGSEQSFVAESAHSGTALMSKYKLYSSGSFSLPSAPYARYEAVNPRLTAALEWYELRGADSFTIWTGQTSASQVDLLVSLYIGE